VLAYKGGIMDGESLDPDGFAAIARLPALDVLHGQLVGMTASPLTGLVAGMDNLISGLGRQLAQIAEQGLVEGEAPAEEEPTEAAEETETQDAGASDEVAEGDEGSQEEAQPEPDGSGGEAEQPAVDSEEE
jgi:large subunit ribosomal protein L10